MRQLEKHLVGEMLGKQDGSFATAGRAKVEALAGEGPEVVMSALRIPTADTGHTLQIVSADTKPVPDLLDTLKAVLAVGGGVLLIVVLTEVGEVAFEDGVEVVVAARNVSFLRGRLCNSWCAHIKTYGENRLPASQRVWIYRLQHNIAHPPDAFSELSLLRGRR